MAVAVWAGSEPPAGTQEGRDRTESYGPTLRWKTSYSESAPHLPPSLGTRSPHLHREQGQRGGLPVHWGGAVGPSEPRP